MKKQELIALAEELAALDDLSSKRKELDTLKREYRRIANQDEESFADKLENEKLRELYGKIAGKEVSLNASALEEKQEILASMKALLERKDFVKANKDMDELLARWKQAGRIDKEVGDAMWEEVRAVRSTLIERKNAYFEELTKTNEEKKAKKQAIIEKAKEVLAIENIKEATAKMDELMNEWKAVGRGKKEIDDALWEEFYAVRKEFMAKRKAHFEHMNKVYAERAEKKAALVKEVRFFVADATYQYGEMDKIKEFRQKYKEIGFAGKEKDDALYAEFNAAIEQYFTDRKSYAGK